MDSPLYKALSMMKEQTRVVINLIRKGASVNEENPSKETLLNLAVQAENPRVVKLLLKAGADVNAKGIYKNTPLHAAALFTENLDILKLLVKFGADVNAKNNDGMTPLHCCALSDKLNVNSVKFLLDAGANVNALDNFASTPMHQAAENDSGIMDVLKLLLSAGADVNAKDFYEETPLHRVFYTKGFDLEILKLLLEAGADINAKNSIGDTPSNKVFEYTGICVDELKFLLKAGFDVNTYNEDGDSTLTLLTMCLSSDYEENIIGTAESIKFLIEYCDINIGDDDKGNIVSNIFENNYLLPFRKYSFEIILEHIAKLKALDLQIDPRLLDTISKNNDNVTYFTKCQEELEKAKNTRIKNCWVTFFNLIVDSESKFVKYAGNEDLLLDFEKNVEKFPIYGSTMRSNVSKGVHGRKLFDQASNILSYLCPIFDPFHLIIRGVLETLSNKDWKQLSEKKRLRET